MTESNNENIITIKLYNKSCFELMESIESETIDLILIDPPYEISKPTGFANGGGIERFAISMDFGEWDKDFSGLDIVINQAYRILKKGGTFICFYDIWKITTLKDHMEKAKFKQIRFIEWLKTNPVPINSKLNYLTNAREIALSGVKVGNPTFNSQYHNGIFNHPIYHTKERFHPTQKPVKLISELIELHSNPGEIVLDCFAGSGTAAISSIETGRNFIGCELDPQYHQKSMERIQKQNNDRAIIEQ